MENFKNPDSKYRGLPFWSWNCKVTKELIDEQLPIFKEMGFGGVVIHPREGLDIEYLGTEFMSLIKYTADKCMEMGLICWLYDDDRFPSGAADGLVTKNPYFRARQLRLTKTKLAEGYYDSREEFEAEIDKGNIPRGYYLTAYDITLNNKLMTRYRRLNSSEEISSADNVYFAYLELQEESLWFQGQTYVDTMNPQAVNEFINITHERYKTVLGEDFGKCAEAIFTDEPRMGKQPLMKEAAGGEDGYAPYNEYFSDQFKEKYGFDALDIVPEFIWDNADGTAYNRLIYRDMAAECFASVFMDRICDWCKENGIVMTGHILAESPLTAQTTTVGDAMRSYRCMDIPGFDLLIDGREFTSAVQAASVAAQNGIKDVMSEEYGVTNWDATFKTFKLQGDWQAALGVTRRVPHLSHMSLEGEAKRDWPGSIFYHAPWYKEFRSLENYFARVNTALTSGTRQTRIALVHPVESMWVKFSPDDTSLSDRKKLDKEFTDLADWLLYSLLDYNYLCESLIPKQDIAYSNKKLRVGCAEYDVILVPPMLTIRSTTLDMLENFVRCGGTVIFAGDTPYLVDGKISDRAKRLCEKCTKVAFDNKAITAELDGFRDIEVLKADGTRSDNLFYQLRNDDCNKWLFITHVNYTGTLNEEYTVKINGTYNAELYDTMNGDVYSVTAIHKGGKTMINWICGGEDSLLLKLCDAEIDLPEYKPTAEPHIIEVLDSISSFRLHEDNMLLLDYARFAVDGGKIQDTDEILRLENKIRQQLGYYERTGEDMQPYAVNVNETHTVTLYYEFHSEIDSSVKLGIENSKIKKVFLNEIEADNTPVDWYVDKSIKVINLPDIKAGKNELRIETQFTSKTFLENVYLLGNFSVTTDRVITEPIKKLSLGSILSQGLPYYTGSIDYEFDVKIEDAGEYYLRVPEFNAPALAVYIDGIKKGIIAYSPHRISLGVLENGNHTITVNMYGNRFNGFGMLHNANENYTWYGNGSYRTTGKDWTNDYMLRNYGIMSQVLLEK